MPPTRLLERRQHDDLVFREFANEEAPAYAVLSHTWLTDNSEEVSFQDLETGLGKTKAGWRKIQFCADKAWADGLRYFWIDTCCIDKKNNTELSKAINSMFRWYQNATRCYVYLSDVSVHGSEEKPQPFPFPWEAAFRKSRWFTRGWTLQELLAPKLVEFFSLEGERLGSKLKLEATINDITAIPWTALRGEALHGFSCEERMSWASRRQTREEEDHAYALLGIFGVSMPLIYGEGKEKALRRLREEIEKDSREKIAESKVFTVGSNSTFLQEASRGQSSFTTRSPDWLKPIVNMPSRDFISNARSIDSSLHRPVAAVIIHNCRIACFDFYHTNGLWRTKYGKRDTRDMPKLFQLDTGEFPQSGEDMTLRDWLVKIRRAARWNEDDAIRASDVHDFLGLGDLFSRMTRICSLLDHEGKLAFEDFEQNLLTSLELCRQLNGWDSFGRLRVLWEDLHKPSAELDLRSVEFRLRLESLWA